MSHVIAIVTRGSVDVADEVDDDTRFLSRVCHLGHLRRYNVGEILLLEAADFLRLQRLGVVRAV